jgi:hypothetical protein
MLPFLSVILLALNSLVAVPGTNQKPDAATAIHEPVIIIVD